MNITELYQNIVGKMYEVTMSSGRQEFVIIAEIEIGDQAYPHQYLLYWPEQMKYEKRSIPGILSSIKYGYWKEI